MEKYIKKNWFDEHMLMTIDDMQIKHVYLCLKVGLNICQLLLQVSKWTILFLYLVFWLKCK